MPLKGSYTRKGGKKKLDTAVKRKSMEEKSPYLLGAWKSFTEEVIASWALRVKSREAVSRQMRWTRAFQPKKTVYIQPRNPARRGCVA